MTELFLEGNEIGDAGAAAIADRKRDRGQRLALKLQTLYVPVAIEHNPQLVAACRAKGVEACLRSERVGSRVRF